MSRTSTEAERTASISNGMKSRSQREVQGKRQPKWQHAGGTCPPISYAETEGGIALLTDKIAPACYRTGLTDMSAPPRASEAQ